MSFLDYLREKKAANLLFIIGIMLLIVAVYVAFWSLHPVLILELVLIIGGLFLIFLWYLVSLPQIGVKEKEISEKPGLRTIASRIIKKLTFGGRLRPYFPLFAILLFILVYFYNRFLSLRSDLGSGDLIVIGIAIMLLIYDRIPERFAVEQDFVLIFLILVFCFLILPLALYNVLIGDPDLATESPWVHFVVSLPASYLATLIGIPAHALWLPDQGSFISYKLSNGGEGIVGIALGCSGLYSVIIFSCAYAAYIFSSYERFERRLVYVLLIGLVLAWFANLIRIALTIGAGRWWGQDKLIWFHENIGILIFLAWVALFWFLVFKFFSPFRLPKGKTDST